MSAPLLDRATRARLERLALVARRRQEGRALGERRTRRRGGGLDFAGHRDYAAGDDLRLLDWSLLARLGRPYVRTYEEERETLVHLLVDATRSMKHGALPKELAARRLAAALAQLGIAAGARVGLFPLGEGLDARLRVAGRGRVALPRLLEALGALGADASGGVGASLRAHAASARAGLTVVVSDFLDPELPAALAAHAERGHELWLLALLALEEREPPEGEELEFEDAETGALVRVSLGPRERAAYRARVAAHRESLEDFARRRRARVVHLEAEAPLVETLAGPLVEAGLVGGR